MTKEFWENVTMQNATMMRIGSAVRLWMETSCGLRNGVGSMFQNKVINVWMIGGRGRTNQNEF